MRRALGVRPGSDVEVELDESGARLLVDRDRTAEEIASLRGAGQGEMGAEEILALTRR